ncbi:PAS domain-containing hybrid sensor histidine kinase/response regulator [Flavobacterium cerinum]|uniref:histidine kinase n=1 Tax=Flavobacterium cerinum TaxID=2502784 RepID=A0ABY5INC9_9FLAO|nr:PAS domain-containing hybrid sensor histidine kinase/response regulator [Flavobacterium cerinum]UUC44353.1 PAS domain S-box protein [Flavobacterium cerinum]
MTYHKLLQKQIIKYLPKTLRQHNDMNQFLDAIDATYQTYEKEKNIMHHAFQESEKEYNEVNESLKKEYELKKRSIDNLYESLQQINEEPIMISDKEKNDLLFISGYLNEQINKRRESEESLNHTIQLLKTLLANLQSGILVEDKDRNILFVNQLFCDFFQLGKAPDDLIGQNCKAMVIESCHLFKDSGLFKNRFETIFKNKMMVTNEIMETIDGRFFERDHVPILVNGELKGHLWKYTDVTEREKTLSLIEQSEERNRLIMNAALNAIINIDSKGNITFWNRQATKMFGWSQTEVFGKSLTETIIPSRYIEGHNKGMKHYLETGEGPVLNKQIELTGLNREGNEFPIEISILPIEHNDEKFFCAFIEDISERKKAENSLKAQEEKYRNIIANMNMGLIEVDRDENILYANQGFLTISGYELDEILGKYAPELFMFDEHLELVKAKRKLRENGISNLFQLPVKNKKGELRWWAISGGPNYDDNGEWIGSIGIHLDITEQKRLEIALKNEKIKAQQASKSKEAFLAQMSHEIRTPLNAIVGFLRELSKQQLTSTQRDYINNSEIASKHLLAIINNVLDISKIEAGEMALENTDFVLENTIGNVITVLSPRAREKGLTVHKNVAPEISKVLKGDELRLEQILFNLLGNAIKFTAKGEILIHCDLIQDDISRQKVRISVKDTGIGMDAGYVKDIFKKFSQEDKAATTKKYGGTGLGMFITKELVQLMKGRIEIESEKGIGTTFHIYLKLEKGDPERVQTTGKKREPGSLQDVSVLLVEDNILNRMVAQNSLKYYNCQVEEAENGLKAIEILKQKKFDVILMDIQMPEMDGIKATKVIRKELQLDTPIIALTANAFKTEIDRCYAAGMNDYVTKPFDEDVLIGLIAKYGMKKRQPDVLQPESETEQKLYNLEMLRELSGNSDDFIREVVQVFMTQVTEMIDKGESAMEKEEFTDLGKLVHKIRPSVESLRITSIADELKLLEQLAKDNDEAKEIKMLYAFVKMQLQTVVAQLNKYELH